MADSPTVENKELSPSTPNAQVRSLRTAYFDKQSRELENALKGKTLPFGQIGVLTGTDLKIGRLLDRSHAVDLPEDKGASSFTIVLGAQRVQEDLNPGEKPGTRVWRGQIFVEAKYDKNKKLESVDIFLYPDRAKYDEKTRMRPANAEVYTAPIRKLLEPLMQNAPHRKN